MLASDISKVQFRESRWKEPYFESRSVLAIRLALIRVKVKGRKFNSYFTRDFKVGNLVNKIFVLPAFLAISPIWIMEATHYAILLFLVQ